MMMLEVELRQRGDGGDRVSYAPVGDYIPGRLVCEGFHPSPAQE